MKIIHLTAPFAGWAGPLDEVPDPVFAERMMGDGIAIEPLEGLVRAPCDAAVIAVAPTGHSITLRLANGAELLIHIGLETVALGGNGFMAETRDGAQVRRGDPLIRFDLDRVAAHAKSLITPIVIANQGYQIEAMASGSIRPGMPLMKIVADRGSAEAAPLGHDTAECEIVIPMTNGVHARPAARIAAALKPFSAEMEFAAHARNANARSPVALMTLGLRQGDIVRLTARGNDSRAAIAAIAALIESGMGEMQTPEALVPSASIPASTGLLFGGVRAAPGLTIGPVIQFAPADIEVSETGKDISQESATLDDALRSLSAELGETNPGPAAEIAAAHRALLDDPELRSATRTLLELGKSAAFAWRAATRAQAEAIRATGNALLIERIADLTDLERRVIASIKGDRTPAMPILPKDAILIAGELLPSHFMALDTTRLGGIATVRGGPTSHVAILAASAGIPMLVACGEGLLRLADGATAVLDADAGTLDGDPMPDTLAEARERHQMTRNRRAAEASAAQADCVMADGTRIEIFANLASVEEAAQAISLGAEGCGLLRTEFLFLDRVEAPSEGEQQAIYAAVAGALGGRPLIVRTLDIGGDKPVPYLPFPHEENPALGNRGVRLGLQRPDLLATQFRAILKGIPASQCRIMLPMIVDNAEFRAAKAIFAEAMKAAGVTGHVPLGVMIETPSAALLADHIAAEADFLSIGSNDLTQYALAADRGNPAVANMVDAFHPAVLRLIAEAGKGSAKHGRWLGLCGGLASDPDAAAILIGLGVTELSAAPAQIPALKAAVRMLTMDRCRALSARALRAGSAEEVHALLKGEA